MADISELLGAEAQRLQPDNPPPFEELLATRRMRDRRNRLATGTVMLLAVAGVAFTATLYGAPKTTTDTAKAPSWTGATVAPPAGSVKAHLTLPSTTVRSGETLTGQVTIENNTGRTIRVGVCGPLYQVLLIGGDNSESAIWRSCLRWISIPRGQSTYTVGVMATYKSCSELAHAGVPRPCRDDGSPPPLPPGEYHATTFASDEGAPLPAPVSVTVTP